jgi:molybdopterin-guanine dinucleotide biosynthesis protein
LRHHKALADAVAIDQGQSLATMRQNQIRELHAVASDLLATDVHLLSVM